MSYCFGEEKNTDEKPFTYKFSIISLKILTTFYGLISNTHFVHLKNIYFLTLQILGDLKYLEDVTDLVNKGINQEKHNNIQVF